MTSNISNAEKITTAKVVVPFSIVAAADESCALTKTPYMFLTTNGYIPRPNNIVYTFTK